VGHVIVGAWVSTTITNCVQLAPLPLLSVAVQMTAFVPFGNCAGALLTTVTLLEQLSVALALPSTTPLAVQTPGSVLVVTVAGQVMTGACMSATITNCVQLLELPQPSVAVHATWLVPLGN